MKKQTTEFAIQTEKKVVKNVGRSTIVQPKTNFGGGHIRWCKDKPKKNK